MSFRNYDNWYQDFEYDSDPNPSPSRCRSPFRRSRSPIRRSTSSPPRSARPQVGYDGWEILPEELLRPENWGLPPSSLIDILDEGQDIIEVPGVIGRRLDTRRGRVIQFYPDHDPDLINTNQLDGLPYILRPSTSLSLGARPMVVKSAAYNAANGGKQPRLSFSQRWEQGLLEMAHENPHTLVRYSHIPPGKRGGFKSFSDIHGSENEGGGGGDGQGGTVAEQNFVAYGKGRGQPFSAPSSTQRYTSGGPGQPFSSGGASGGGEQPLEGQGAARVMPTIYEPARTLGGNYYSGAYASRQAAREAAIRRDAATKAEQMRKAAWLKKAEYLKEINKKKAQEVQEMKEAEEAKKESVKQEKLEGYRAARDIREREWVEKPKDVLSLPAEAAVRRDAATKDLQHQPAEHRRQNTGARPEARDAKARDVEVKYRDAGELARDAAGAHFKAMNEEKKTEDSATKTATKAPPKTATKAASGLKPGPVKLAPKLTPAPSEKATSAPKPSPKPTPAKSAPEKKTLPTRPASKPSPTGRSPLAKEAVENDEKEPLDPREAVCRAITAREAVIRALPKEPESDDEVLNPATVKPTPLNETPTKPVSKPATTRSTTAMPVLYAATH